MPRDGGASAAAAEAAAGAAAAAANGGDGASVSVSMDVWINTKENVQPLREGRDATALATVVSPDVGLRARQRQLAARRAEFERQLAIEKQKGPAGDVMDVWRRYIHWAQQSYPTDAAASEVLALVTRCTGELGDSPAAANDIRYLAVWIRYADLRGSDGAADVFRYLEQHRIGLQHALYYEALSAWHELNGRFADAKRAYQAGMEAKAAPQDRLTRHYREFIKRCGRNTHLRKQRAAAAAAASADDDGAGSRAALGVLSASTAAAEVGSVRLPARNADGTLYRAALPSAGAVGGVKRAASSSAFAGAPEGGGAARVQIFAENEDPAEPVMSLAQKRARSESAAAGAATPASVREAHKENTMGATVWSTAGFGPKTPTSVTRRGFEALGRATPANKHFQSPWAPREKKDAPVAIFVDKEFDDRRNSLGEPIRYHRDLLWDIEGDEMQFEEARQLFAQKAAALAAAEDEKRRLEAEREREREREREEQQKEEEEEEEEEEEQAAAAAHAPQVEPTATEAEAARETEEKPPQEQEKEAQEQGNLQQQIQEEQQQENEQHVQTLGEQEHQEQKPQEQQQERQEQPHDKLEQQEQKQEESSEKQQEQTQEQQPNNQEDKTKQEEQEAAEIPPDVLALSPFSQEFKEGVAKARAGGSWCAYIQSCFAGERTAALPRASVQARIAAVPASEPAGCSSLEDLLATYKKRGKKVEEVLAVYYAVEVLECLRICSTAAVVHGRVSPAAFLLRYGAEEEEWPAWEPAAAACEHGSSWTTRGLTLVGFSDDATVDASFVQPEQCVGRPLPPGLGAVCKPERVLWAADSLGAADVLHRVVFEGAPLQAQDSKGRVVLAKSVRRTWRSHALWAELFDTLLNWRDAEQPQRPPFAELLAKFEGFLCADAKRVKSLAMLLLRQQIMQQESDGSGA